MKASAINSFEEYKNEGLLSTEVLANFQSIIKHRLNSVFCIGIIISNEQLNQTQISLIKE